MMACRALWTEVRFMGAASKDDLSNDLRLAVGKDQREALCR